ncbi:MAG TPA: hypothetical protein VG889_20135 [Rhizomicrobium sp.]|nr:hypothetical protein [Rhizomicrobium sp.]
MRARLFAVSLAVAAALGQAAAADALKPVYRVDSGSAIVVDRHLVITANGAVKSGGWDKPKLLVIEPSAPEARILKVQFVARPPAPNEVVVQQLLPIVARKVAHLPRYATTEVQIIAETNSVIVQITQ